MRFPVVLLLILLAAIPAHGDETDPFNEWPEAQKLLVRQDWGGALKLLFPLAVLDHAPAQAALARLYEAGQGVPLNECYATLWADKAARRGDGWAQMKLARAYEIGLGLWRDPALAYRWARTAALKGELGAEKMARDLEARLGPQPQLPAGWASGQPPAEIMMIPDRHHDDLEMMGYYEKAGLRGCRNRPPAPERDIPDPEKRFEAGEAAVQAERYNEVVDLLLPMAVSGRVEAMAYVSRVYVRRRHECRGAIWTDKAARRARKTLCGSSEHCFSAGPGSKRTTSKPIDGFILRPFSVTK
jgi:hypothetical protein